MRLRGHAAGGILVARALLPFLRPKTESHRRALLITGALAGTMPDWDYLVYALRNKRLGAGSDFRHHQWITHTFLFHWIISAGMYFIGKIRHDELLRKRALVVGAGTTIHLVQDTIGTGDGIMLFYPLSRRMYGIALSGLHGTQWENDYIKRPIYHVEQSIVAAAIGVLAFETLRAFQIRMER